MIYVLRPDVVASALARLRERWTHQLFGGYLHLVQLASREGRLARLTPHFKDFFDRYFRVPDHPLGSPYIRPFIDKRPTPNNFWFNENVAGSYAPSSVRPGLPFRKVVDVEGKHYSLKPEHEALALTHLLDDEPLSLTNIALVLLRDRGFVGERVFPWDVVRALRIEFGNSDDWQPVWAAREERVGTADDAWLVPFDGDVADEVVRERYGSATKQPVRQLKSADLRPSSQSVNHHPCLRRLAVSGLLSFGERTEFSLGKLNLLVGANGSGKSNLIDCIRVLRSTADDDENIQQIFRPAIEHWLFKSGAERSVPAAELEAEVAVEGIWLPLRHRLRVSPAGRQGVGLQETIHAADQGEFLLFAGATATVLTGAGRRRREDQLPDDEFDPALSILNQKRDLAAYPEITRLQRLYSRWRIYSEWTFGRESKLREASPASGGGGPLLENMANLAGALSAIVGTSLYETRLRPLLAELKETYRDVRMQSVLGKIAMELIEGQFKAGIPAERLSDGTLRFLAMATILFHPDPPPLICLEEPELGMHPDAIAMVADMIAVASERSQLIVTTHSQHLMTSLQDRFDVLFAFDTGPTGSMVRRLTQDEYRKWRADHALGELWSSGEIGGVRY